MGEENGEFTPGPLLSKGVSWSRGRFLYKWLGIPLASVPVVTSLCSWSACGSPFVPFNPVLQRGT